MKDTLSDRSRSASLLYSLQGIPFDAVVAVATMVAVDALLVVAPTGHPGLRLVLGGGLLVVLPGYAVVSALLPGWLHPPAGTGHGPPRASVIELVERAALSVGIGLAMVPLLALVLAVSGLGLDLRTAAPALTLLVVVGLVVGVVRRRAAPPDRRFSVGLGVWAEQVRRAVVHPSGGRALSVLDVLLALAVVGATASFGVSLAFPQDGERYTGFALRTTGPGGDLVAGGFPEELTVGTNESLVAVVDNHEGERVPYTVVVQLQRVRRDDGALVVTNRRELARANRTLGPGERWTYAHTVRPPPEATGTNRRLAYLLYRDDGTAPYRRLGIWVDVVG